MSKDVNLEWIERSGGYEWTPGSPWPPNVPDEEDVIMIINTADDYNRDDPDRERAHTEAFQQSKHVNNWKSAKKEHSD